MRPRLPAGHHPPCRASVAPIGDRLESNVGLFLLSRVVLALLYQRRDRRLLRSLLRWCTRRLALSPLTLTLTIDDFLIAPHPVVAMMLEATHLLD